MKIKSFCWLLLAFSGAIRAGINVDQVAVSFYENSVHYYATNTHPHQSLPTEKNLRHRLYWLDKNTPHYFLLDSFQDDLDYYIATLTDHIAVLENKIAQKQSALKSSAMQQGVAFGAIAALMGCGAHRSYITRNNQAIWNASIQEAAFAAFSFGVITVFFSTAAGLEFYKAYNYNERLIERLNRDIRILADLKQAKAVKNS